MIRRSLIAAVALLLGTVAGCSSLQDHVVDVETGLRNRVLAQQAWNEWSWCYDDLDHPYHFAKGFKDGYRAVLAGGNGCQPTLPPRCYWKPQFQTPEGRCVTHAWFDGYSHGALAAQQDGYGNLNEIPISPTARANLISKRATPAAGLFPVSDSHTSPLHSPAAVGAGGGIVPAPAARPLLPEADVVPDGPRPYDEAVHRAN
ncbi:MAG: hypothetical protein KDA85_01065 [Planctomycetaceae bacterium]|nr:hypothetical protein [Planctomycetaceae bacterium]